MSRLLSTYEYDGDTFDLGDRASFDFGDTRLTGTVVRVYNTREDYHVEVGGRRYSVNRMSDNMQKVTHD